MDLDEVVGEIIQSHGSGVILQFAAESIRQSCVAPQRRADRPVLPFNNEVETCFGSVSVLKGRFATRKLYL
jgi:hypothetical protein